MGRFPLLKLPRELFNSPLVRGFEKGLAIDRASNAAKILPQNCVHLLLREEEEKGCRKDA